MIIKKIKLENIRSYLNQEIEFPLGTVLLAGNVGSGKSTILLALDFALFGLQKNLEGASLLRNGETHGKVEVVLDIDGKEVKIKRALRKEGQRILQDAGNIIIENELKNLTATQLKHEIVSLLNYPRDIVKKHKPFFYRYTVYTPQEDMKHILLADKETRLDVLRKVFGVDKYKRLKENSAIIISWLKGLRKEYEGFSSDLEVKKQELAGKQKTLNNLKAEINKLLPEIENIKNSILAEKKRERELKNKIENVSKLKQDLTKKEAELKFLVQRKESLVKEIDNLEKEISSFEFKDINLEKIKSEIDKKEKELMNLEKEIDEAKKVVAEYQAKKENSQELLDKISKLDICPTCKQEVTEEHKQKIRDVENKKIENFENMIKEFSKKLEEKLSAKESIKADIELLRHEEKEASIYKTKLELLEEKKKRNSLLKQELSSLAPKIEDLEKEKSKIEDEILSFGDLEKQYQALMLKLEELLAKEKELLTQKASLEGEIKNISATILELENEIKSKELAMKKVGKIKELISFIEKDFSALLDQVEREIMLKIHYDFDSTFQKWFYMLMDNELIKVRLDEEFTPIIEQNGYNIDYNYLSGGERTAVALAYRLALNHVINTLMANIKTRDLIILDEPTDGFSAEQIERMRYLLQELKAKQIIIVSHDPKIESFVDSIIKLRKEGHVTVVEQS